MQFQGASHHQLLDLHKIRGELGYADRVDPLTGIERTVRWLRDNPPEDAEYLAEVRAQYDLEDRLAAIYHQACERMAALEHPEKAFHHSYAHPRERGLARDHRNR